MIIKDSQGNTVDFIVEGTSPDDLEVVSAVYINSGLDVSEDEIQFILDNHYGIIYQDLFGDLLESSEYSSEIGE